MLARIAQELFWLGRNLARAEHTARLLEGVFQADLQGRPEGQASATTLSWESLMHIMGGRRDREVSDGRDAVLDALTHDPDNPASVVACVTRAREGASAVRDVISAEMWEAINTTHLRLHGDDFVPRDHTGHYDIYQHVRERSALFWGLTGRTMLRDEASAFLLAAGRIEAGDMVLRMLRVALPDLPDGNQADAQALALIQAVGGFQAYRRAVPAPAHAKPVARFLLFERNYPDSVAAAVDAVNESLRTADSHPRASEPILRLSRLSADLEFRRSAETDADLRVTCHEVQRELGRVDADIAQRYFGGARAA